MGAETDGTPSPTGTAVPGEAITVRDSTRRGEPISVLGSMEDEGAGVAAGAGTDGCEGVLGAGVRTIPMLTAGMTSERPCCPDGADAPADPGPELPAPVPEPVPPGVVVPRPTSRDTPRGELGTGVPGVVRCRSADVPDVVGDAPTESDSGELVPPSATPRPGEGADIAPPAVGVLVLLAVLVPDGLGVDPPLVCVVVSAGEFLPRDRVPRTGSCRLRLDAEASRQGTTNTAPAAATPIHKTAPNRLGAIPPRTLPSPTSFGEENQKGGGSPTEETPPALRPWLNLPGGAPRPSRPRPRVVWRCP